MKLLNNDSTNYLKQTDKKDLLDGIIDDLSPNKMHQYLIQHEIEKHTCKDIPPICENEQHFKNVILKYIIQHKYNTSGEVIKDKVVAYGKALELLKSYPGGDRRALYHATTGIDGGIYNVIKFIANKLKEQNKKYYIEVSFEKCGLSENNYKAHKEVMQQYVKKYSSFLPEISNASIDYLASNYKKILLDHIEFTLKLKEQFNI